MDEVFVGIWECCNKQIEISKQKKTYRCSFGRGNIGILFRDSLIVSEFDNDAQAGGVGVYSPIGDGASYYALWSSNNIFGTLDSGIARKIEDSQMLQGEYIMSAILLVTMIGSLLSLRSSKRNAETFMNYRGIKRKARSCTELV